MPSGDTQIHKRSSDVSRQRSAEPGQWRA